MSELDRELEALRKETREKLEEEAQIERRIEELTSKPVETAPVEKSREDEDEDGDELSSGKMSPLAIVALTTGVLIAVVALWNIVFAPLAKLAILVGIVLLVVALLAKALRKGGGDADDDDDKA
ncbi:hypothetical protein HY251_09490 [bacterium]|nr:hypothetical protein [bacterium]